MSSARSGPASRRAWSSPDGKYLYIADYSGTITRTAVASTIVSGTEQLALQRRGSMQWFSPELQQYAPALA